MKKAEQYMKEISESRERLLSIYVFLRQKNKQQQKITWDTDIGKEHVRKSWVKIGSKEVKADKDAFKIMGEVSLNLDRGSFFSVRQDGSRGCFKIQEKLKVL